MFNSPSFALTMTDPQKERKLDRSFKLLASSHSLLEPAWLAGPSGGYLVLSSGPCQNVRAVTKKDREENERWAIALARWESNRDVCDE